MKEERIASEDTGGANEGGNKNELRLRRVEYIFARFEYDESNYVRNVLNETKPRLGKTGPDKYGSNGL